MTQASRQKHQRIQITGKQNGFEPSHSLRDDFGMNVLVKAMRCDAVGHYATAKVARFDA